MLDPTELPDDLRELESELSRPGRQELSRDLRHRVMESVQNELGPTVSRPRAIRRLVVMSVVGSVAAAAMMIVILPNVSPRNVTEPDDEVASTSVEDSPEPRHAPTIQTFRLALNDSPGDWQSQLDRVLDTDPDSGDLTDDSIAFRPSRFLEDDR